MLSIKPLFIATSSHDKKRPDSSCKQENRLVPLSSEHDCLLSQACYHPGHSTRILNFL